MLFIGMVLCCLLHIEQIDMFSALEVYDNSSRQLGHNANLIPLCVWNNWKSNGKRERSILLGLLFGVVNVACLLYLARDSCSMQIKIYSWVKMLLPGNPRIPLLCPLYSTNQGLSWEKKSDVKPERLPRIIPAFSKSRNIMSSCSSNYLSWW